MLTMGAGNLEEVGEEQDDKNQLKLLVVTGVCSGKPPALCFQSLKLKCTLKAQVTVEVTGDLSWSELCQGRTLETPLVPGGAAAGTTWMSAPRHMRSFPSCWGPGVLKATAMCWRETVCALSSEQHTFSNCLMRHYRGRGALT